MAIFKYQGDNLLALTETSFAKESIKGREDLQRLIKEQFDIISPDTLVILKNLVSGK